MPVICKSFLVKVPGKTRRKRVTFSVKICIAPRKSKKPTKKRK